MLPFPRLNPGREKWTVEETKTENLVRMMGRSQTMTEKIRQVFLPNRQISPKIDTGFETRTTVGTKMTNALYGIVNASSGIAVSFFLLFLCSVAGA